MSAFVQGLIEGMVVAWPPAVAGMWLTWYLARRKVQQVADQQTKDIEALTHRQTATLLGQLPGSEAPADPDRYA